MQFYKIQGRLTEHVLDEEDRMARREASRRIASKTEEFNEADSRTFCFLSDMDDNAVFGVIAACAVDPLQFTEKYAEFIGLRTDGLIADEITLGSMQRLLSTADRQSYISDDDTILELFELDNICGRMGRSLEFGENLVNYEAQKKDLFDSARRYFMTDTLIPELERIYEGTKSPRVSGHPVHYIVETDDHDTRREVYKIVLDALYANNRLSIGRYTFLNFSPCSEYSHMAFETLYKVSEGGAVVVRYQTDGDSADEDASAGSEHEVIEHICQTARLYRNKVLTIICLPRECKKVKSIFFEYLGNMAFVEVREDFIDSVAAKAFLSARAKDHHIRTDKKLFARLDSDRSYLSAELETMFSEWYDAKLKTTVYPQYKEIAAARQEVVKAKPRGSAYDELMEMIGLTDAKQVIKKALNYYKMQKLYEEKGVKKDYPAMHMIFSGNPGTAKTTVARLFARIMRENGLLSRGHLVEVGRGDLVGKYVGWTAQTVQAKFKAAMGGVLFVDEAYSLVDGHSGSFGDEAINTIVQEMENHRADVVVIFAGYPDKMEDFLQKNPGLRSRIAFHVPFVDYSSAELCQIASMMSQKNGMRLEQGALDKLEKAFDAAKAEVDFGNGRYVRNMFEQAKMNQATRLLDMDFDAITSEQITTITADDIVIPDVKKPEKRRIGF